MTVLHLISSGGMYGAEAVILNLCSALSEGSQHRGVVVVFANSTQPHLELHEAALKAGVESHVLPCRGQIDRHVPKAIRELVRQTGADVVHAHGYKADVYAYAALHGTKFALVSTCHTWYDNDLMVRAYGALDRRILRRFRGVVAVSEQVRDRLLKAGVAAKRIRLIQNGIDLQPFLAAEGNRAGGHEGNRAVRVGIVGRLAPEKGIDIFLEAVARVAQQRPGTVFLVAGDGPDRDALEKMIGHLGLKGSVSLLGRMEDMPGFYTMIDVLVSASRKEGLPIALLEGMASGLPVVATSVGAVPQIIQDDITGLLVKAEDPSLLSDAIVRLIDDRVLRDSLGHRAQQLIAEEYSAKRMTADYLEMYRQVLAKSSGYED